MRFHDTGTAEDYANRYGLTITETKLNRVTFEGELYEHQQKELEKEIEYDDNVIALEYK